MTEAKTVRELVKAIKTGTKEKTKGYETSATVQRIEDGIAWVHIPGGVDETPVKMTINAKVGDTVQVRVSGGRATLTGNATSPPTDDATADKALSNANSAMQSARNAQIAANAAEQAAQTAEAAAQDAVETAESVHDIAVQAQTDAETAKTNAQTAITNAAAAQSSADQAASAASQAQTDATAAGTAAANAQSSANAAGEAASRAQAAADAAQGDIDEQQEYFWHDALGAHVLSDTDAVTGKRYRTDLKGSGQKIYELDGTNENLVASFGADGAQIGQTDESHLEMDYHSIRLIGHNETTPYFWLSDLRDKEDNYQATVTEIFKGNGVTNSFQVAAPVSAEVSAVDSSDSTNTAILDGRYYRFTRAPGSNAVVTIVYKTTSDIAKAYSLGFRRGSVGIMSFVEGYNNEASGCYSHAEGYGTIASNKYAHAEGYDSSATGEASHAEGKATASGYMSHAEGNSSATANYAHSEGTSTATGNYSHAEGQADATGTSSHAEGGSTASNNMAHAEGSSEASGWLSHSEGTGEAKGSHSHAQNRSTIAAKGDQTAIGKYNEEDTATAVKDQKALIIGNGSSSARSNALTVGWDGNVHLALDSNASSGTTDNALYAAINDLGWTSDVIV